PLRPVDGFGLAAFSAARVGEYFNHGRLAVAEIVIIFEKQFVKGIVAIMFSLTPCFSAVIEMQETQKTVLTVFRAVEGLAE
ncbi:MAG TPA: hypothetical protein VGI63_01040, partial [Verrucomicrobiae bacterium]